MEIECLICDTNGAKFICDECYNTIEEDYIKQRKEYIKNEFSNGCEECVKRINYPKYLRTFSDFIRHVIYENYDEDEDD
jgi:hypothetical protein